MESTPSSRKGGVFIKDPNRGRRLAAAFLENAAQLDKNNEEKFENLQLRSGAPGTLKMSCHLVLLVCLLLYNLPSVPGLGMSRVHLYTLEMYT
ncbi:uncharacterized protein N7473_003646 [Penicillium subrubescens]|uniref:uncharacterized protein n=1 Tax=Penicillium subrubescens TaxID=1316194 RepID=UPI002545656E|nr:uncharacterized protein N7473_003646 [Penicillium subrubescens]KAJ5906730.1 hypothetical protein N7473_003646 [Penicillium subrubescens]